jgi:hypothetical protein
MNHHEIASRLGFRPLCEQQDLDVGLGADEAALDGEFGGYIGAWPEVSGYGLQVGITEERVERGHCGYL